MISQGHGWHFVFQTLVDVVFNFWQTIK